MALARRDLLLRVHRHRLRIEDLEDCYSQATLELIQRARSGAPFANHSHIAHALELRLLSRIHDRRRALGGRSSMEAALGQAAALDPPDGGCGQLADQSPGVHDQVATRRELAVLREIARELTPDMRLVIAEQAGGTECAEFCRRFGWSPEKFRKVAQRARRRLLGLSREYASGARCRRLESDLLAYVSGVADDEQRERIKAHLANCTACRRRARELRAAEACLLGLLPGGLQPAPTGVTVAAAGSTAGGVGAATGGGAVAWGGPGLLGVKLGVAAVCLVSLAGGGLALCRGGPLAGVLSDHRAPHRIARPAWRPHVPEADRQPELARADGPTPQPRAAASVATRGRRSALPSVAAPSPTATGVAAATREFGFSALAPAGLAAGRQLPAPRVTPPSSPPGRGSRHHDRRRHRPPSRLVHATVVAQTAPLGRSASPSSAASHLAVTAPRVPAAAPASGEFGFERG